MPSALLLVVSPLWFWHLPYLHFVLPLILCVAVVRLWRSIPWAVLAAMIAGVGFMMATDRHSLYFFGLMNGGLLLRDGLIMPVSCTLVILAVTGMFTARRWLPRRPGEPLVHRHFRQFSLATLFAVVTVAACGLAVGRYFIVGILQFLPLILVLAIMVNPFRVIGDWARGRARLQAVRARLRRHAEQAGTLPSG